MHFEELNASHAAVFLDFVADLKAHDPGTFKRWFDREWSDFTFAQYARECERDRMDWRPKAGQISRTAHLLIDDGVVNGFGLLRFPLTPAIERDGGNLVFIVPPSRRGRGWGVQTLNRLLFVAARAGLARAWVSCAENDAAARRCIKQNRGESTGVEDHRESFWIPLR